MPILNLQTNVDLGDKKPDVMKGCYKAISQGLGKPEQYIAVSITDNASVSFGYVCVKSVDFVTVALAVYVLLLIFGISSACFTCLCNFEHIGFHSLNARSLLLFSSLFTPSHFDPNYDYLNNALFPFNVPLAEHAHTK